MKTTIHRTAEYFVKFNGKLLCVTHRPTDQYEGQKASDLPTLHFLPYAKDLNFMLWLGDSIIIEQNITNSVQTYSETVIILAKRTYDWDYSKPLGVKNRMSNEKKTSNWNTLFAEYLKQSKN